MLKDSSALGKPDIVELAMTFEADEYVKEQKGHTPHVLTVNKSYRTAAEALEIAGAAIIVLQGFGSNVLKVAASSQIWFTKRVYNTYINTGTVSL